MDFVIERGRTLIPIEVKATASPGAGDTKALQAFRDDYGARCPGGLLLHHGAGIQWLADRILAVPWHHVI